MDTVKHPHSLCRHIDAMSDKHPPLPLKIVSVHDIQDMPNSGEDLMVVLVVDETTDVYYAGTIKVIPAGTQKPKPNQIWQFTKSEGEDGFPQASL